MKHYYIYKEDNQFDEILKDPIMKKVIYTKIIWDQHMIIGVPDDIDEGTISYFVLKYGDDIKQPSSLIKSRKPIMNVDYRPDKIWKNGKYVKN
jgi:hypothetical protein